MTRVYHGLSPRELLAVPGTIFQSYVDRMDETEAQEILMMAQAFALATSGSAEAWNRAIDRTMPAPAEAETFWRYEGRPVRLPELVGALTDRWGGGFGFEAEGD